MKYDEIYIDIDEDDVLDDGEVLPDSELYIGDEDFEMEESDSEGFESSSGLYIDLDNETI